MTPLIGLTVSSLLVLMGAAMAGIFTGWLIRTLLIDRRRK